VGMGKQFQSGQRSPMQPLGNITERPTERMVVNKRPCMGRWVTQAANQGGKEQCAGSVLGDFEEGGELGMDIHRRGKKKTAFEAITGKL